MRHPAACGSAASESREVAPFVYVGDQSDKTGQKDEAPAIVVGRSAGRCDNADVRPAMNATFVTLNCACLGLLVLLPCAMAQTDLPDQPEANPGRPTVSTPATGHPWVTCNSRQACSAQQTSPEFSSRVGFNEVIKLSVAPRLELLAATEPIAHYTSDGITANSVADVFSARRWWSSMVKARCPPWP